jgi:hypothetical protein
MNKTLFTMLAVLVISVSILAQADATTLKGTISAIEGDHIQIKEQAGKPVLVMLQKTTKYAKSGATVKKSDLKVGIRVAIRARMEEKMKMYAAEEVTIVVEAL